MPNSNTLTRVRNTLCRMWSKHNIRIDDQYRPKFVHYNMSQFNLNTDAPAILSSTSWAISKWPIYTFADMSKIYNIVDKNNSNILMKFAYFWEGIDVFFKSNF